MTTAATDDKPELTARQHEIFDFISLNIQRNGKSPTIRTIADQFGISSPNGVCCHLKALVKKRYLVAVDRGYELAE